MAQTPEHRGSLHRKLAELDAWTELRQETALEPDLPIIDPHHHLWDDHRGRYMFESNFPPDKQSAGYGVLWNAFKRITQNYSAAENKAMYHDTAERVYRLAAGRG